jgi:hypothetical protein
MRMRWTHVVMVALLGALCFGGTFTCHSDHSDHHSTVIVTN